MGKQRFKIFMAVVVALLCGAAGQGEAGTPVFGNMSGLTVPASYKVTNLDFSAIAINDAGQVLSSDCRFYDKGNVISIYTPVQPCIGVGLNNAGQALVFGGYQSPVTYIYSNGNLTQLNTAPWYSPSWIVRPEGINDSGKVIATAEYSGWLSYSVLFDTVNGTSTNLSAMIPGVGYNGPRTITNKGDVSGWYWDANYSSQGYVIRSNIFSQVPYFYPVINDNGVTVGNRSVLDPVTGTRYEHMFYSKNGMEVDLGNFGGSYIRAEAVNEAGLAVGYGAYNPTINGLNYGFVTDGRKLYNLNDLVPAGTPTISTASGINAYGQIAAGVILTPITPPVTTAYPDIAAGKVSLQALDYDFGVKALHYSLNGEAEVIEASGAATIQLVPGVTNTVSYYAIDNADNVETARTITVNLDTVPPVTTPVLNGYVGQNGWFTSAVQVALSAIDNSSGIARTEYSPDGVNWTVYTAPLNITASGVTTVYYRSVDTNNNTEATKSIAVSIDQAAPVTTAVVSGTLGTNGLYTSAVKVALSGIDTASGIARTEYSVDQTTWTAYAATVDIQTDSTTTVYYRSVDLAGNVEAVKSVTFTIDKTAPFIGSMNPAANAVNVPIASSITIIFSEDISTGGAFAGVALMRGLTKVATLNTVSGNTVTIKPVKLLGKMATYTVTVPAGAVIDAAGNNSAASSFSFTTGRR